MAEKNPQAVWDTSKNAPPRRMNRKKQDFCKVREDGVASSWASKGKSENQGKCGTWLEESKTVK